MTTTFQTTREQRREAREAVNAPTACPVEVIPGSKQPPVRKGEGFHWTTSSGQPVRHPNAYRRAWGKPVYHASTIRVEVGELWFTRRERAAAARQAHREARAATAVAEAEALLEALGLAS